MEERKIGRLILKESDVLVLHLPVAYFQRRDTIISLYKQIKERLLDANKKNKILILPSDVGMTVIGENQIEEHISTVDLWHLFDEEGNEINEQ